VLRWVGIDEAGYGPNLGPMVMTAVVAEGRPTHPGAKEGPADRAFELWRDLSQTVDRAGGDPSRLWVDDSKRILSFGDGLVRLQTACLSLLDAIGGSVPEHPAGLFAALGAGDETETELARWHSHAISPWPMPSVVEEVCRARTGRMLEPAHGHWKLRAVRAVVLGPEQFNQRLDRFDSKAKVHFSAFQKLLQFAWDLASDGTPTFVQCDKHGGRHYYLEPLNEAFPGVWIERGTEGPLLSQYHLKAQGQALNLALSPKADQTHGLVALASIVSKTVREVWMDRFNHYWTGQIQGLRPTAGYPLDASRFRLSIERRALALGLGLDLWWRKK
jgi:hypothetical protein